MSHPQLPPPDSGGDLVPRSPLGEAPPGRVQFVESSDQEFAGPESGGLLEYWRMLRRRKGTLVLIAFLGGLAGLLFTLPQTAIYQARTSLEIQGINENFLNMRDVNPTSPGGSGWYPEQDIQTQVRILQSRSLMDRAVNKLNLDQRPLVLNETRLSAWRKALGLPQPRPVSSREDAIRMAAANVKVRAQANTRLIEILCDSTDPRLAVDFANTLAREFIDQNLEARWQTTQHTGEWLQRQMEDIRIKLEKSEEALQNYARASGLLFTAEKDNVAEQRLRQLQEELSRAQADRVTRQSKYELAMQAPPESLPDVLDSQPLRESQVRLTDLRRQLAELTAAFTPAHPRVRKVQAQIQVVETALQRERSNIATRIRNEFEAARRRERLLAADYAAQARLVSEQAARVTHYNILKREVDTNRQLYDSMLQRVKEAGIASALRASNVRIVDPAQPPKGPYKPNLTLNTLLGLMAGTFLGVVFIVMRERADRSLQEPGDARFYLNVSELGVIPSADSRRRLLSAPPAASTDRLELVTWQRKPSVLAESFRAVLASVLFSTRNGDRPRVLVVSSPNPKDGKTTVLSNLGIALAEIDRRVLLIDGDLRRPRLHEIFELENKSGFSDLLRSQKGESFSQRHHGIIQETRIANLFVLPGGSTSLHSVSNLVYSDRLPELLRRLRQEFDMVLIDTPPVLQLADARVIGRHSDAVILVIRANRTTRDAALLACQRFSEDGTSVLGTILNDWNPYQTGNYAYYKYYDRYRQYYHKDAGDGAPAR